MTVIGGYQERIDRTSPLNTVGGFAFETAKWSTWRNPFFTARIGRAGWDPMAGGVMGWLNKKSGGLVNAFLASDEANQLYNIGGRLAQAGSKAAQYGQIPETAVSRVYARVAKSMGTSAEKLKIALAGNRAKHGILGLMGERLHNPVERMAARAADRRFAQAALGSTGRFAERGAIKYTVGRALTGLNAALMLYDVGRVMAGGFNMVAQVGAQARARPYMSMGSGIQDTYMAQTLRQTALASMYSSEMGPRRMMGNEASFLHS